MKYGDPDGHGQIAAHLGLTKQRVQQLINMWNKSEDGRRSSMTTNTIVNPDQAPVGREPLFLGVEFISPKNMHGKQRYRTEAWRLTNGELVVIVTDNGGTSLMNGSEKIAAAIKEQWTDEAELVTIVEDWTSERPFMGEDRFLISDHEGGHRTMDLEEWKAKGLPL